MADFIFDFGNARVKWFDPRNNIYNDFRHAIYEMREHDWERVVGRNGRPPKGIIRVNGTPYAIGDAARRYLIPARPKGASRYNEIYYGAGLAFALSEAFPRSMRSITLMASHAPQDAQYTGDLKLAAKRKWNVVCSEGEFEYDVKEVLTFDEPLGGYSHFSFTEKGTVRKKNPLEEVTTLVLDIGGYTTDVAAVDEGGEIDQLSLRSTRIGVMNLIEDFEDQLRGNNPKMFKDTGDIDPRKIEKAILTGVFRFGKVEIDCATEATAAINALTNEAVQVINAAGGVANYEVFLLTGGGPVMVLDPLQQAIPTGEFILSERNPDLMKYSNVFGGAKLLALLRNYGEI